MVSGGSLTVDGARAGTDAAYGPGHVLEFSGTIRGDSFQHAGFVSNFAFDTPFAIFSTSDKTDMLFARTYVGSIVTNTLLPGPWLGGPHTYRIEWAPTAVTYFIDGSQVATHAVAIGTSMRPLFSDANINAVGLSVDWLRMTPYLTPCTFESRIVDAGTRVTWEIASWTSNLPAATGLTMSIRMGDTPSPDGSWKGFSALPNPGAQIGGSSRYIQYRAAIVDGDPPAHLHCTTSRCLLPRFQRTQGQWASMTPTTRMKMRSSPFRRRACSPTTLDWRSRRRSSAG